jgi:hypothetical protein
MKWIEYPNQADQKAGRNGTHRTGQQWSEGTAPGSKWVIPDGDVSRYCLVRPGTDRGRYSIPADDYPRGPADARGRAHSGRAEVV